MQSKAFSMEDLFAFLNAGVSAFHSTAAAVKILEKNNDKFDFKVYWGLSLIHI